MREREKTQTQNINTQASPDHVTCIFSDLEEKRDITCTELWYYYKMAWLSIQLTDWCNGMNILHLFYLAVVYQYLWVCQ